MVRNWKRCESAGKGKGAELLFFSFSWRSLSPCGQMCSEEKTGSQHSSFQVDYVLWNLSLENWFLFNSLVLSWQSTGKEESLLKSLSMGKKQKRNKRQRNSRTARDQELDNLESEILTTKQERRKSDPLGFNIRPQLFFGVVAFNRGSWN